MEKFINYDFKVTDVFSFYVYFTKSNYAPVKNRKWHAISFSFNGEREVVFENNEKLFLKPYDVVYIPKGSCYKLNVISPSDTFTIDFMLDEEVDLKSFCLNVKNNLKIGERFKSAYNTWKAKKPGYELKVKSDLYYILYALKKLYYTEYVPTNKLDIIKPAVDYIHENYLSGSLRVETLSSLCDITPEYLRSIFKSIYGVSPLTYINNLRIDHAKGLLSSKMYSIAQVAAETGFSDISHFSHKFKSVTGLSPKDFIKKR